MTASSLPIWLRAYTQIAFLGEISPHVRMIAASFDSEKTCVIRYYFDREPTEDEIEQTAVIGTEIASMVSGDQMKKLSEEIVVSTDKKHTLDRLDGTLYSRMEES